MGQTKSKNVAEAIAEVGSDISNYIFVTQQTISQINTKLNLEQCFISGSVNFRNVGQIIGTNRQTVDAIQSVNVTNDIAQNINQKAIAIVKPLKFGHKKSMQVTSRFASQAVNILNVINDVAYSGAYTKGGFNCERQFIIGDVRVGYNTIQEFWQDQVGNYNQTEDIANKILQDITQETGKEVGGIIGTVLLVVVIITIVMVLFSYPMEGFIKRHRPFFITFLCLAILSLPVILYLTNVYPFYFEQSYCTPYSRVIKGKPCDECININTEESYELDNAPLRYINNIFYDKDDKDLPFGLLGMSVRSLCDGNECLYNQGYNAQTWFNSGSTTDRTLWKVDVNPPHGLPPLPNILKVPRDCDDNNYCAVPPEYDDINSGEVLESKTPQIYSPELKGFDKGTIQTDVNLTSSDPQYVNGRLNTMAVLNEDAWRDYINTHGEKGALHARFMLTDFLGYDTTTYINDDEEVRILPGGNIGIARDHKDKVFKFTNFDTPKSWDKRIASGGTVTGPMGVCADREYKVGHAFKSYVNWILIVIIGLIVILIIYFSIPSRYNPIMRE